MVNNILVTGGNGFIGSSLIKKLLENNNNIIYSIYRGKITNDIINERFFKIENFDLAKSNYIALNNINLDYCFHCAANSNYLERDKEHFKADNIDATKNICSYLEKKNIKLFVYLSTIGVHDRNFLSLEKKKLDEKSSMSAKSLYGKSKIRSEKIVKSSTLNHLIIRPTWIYGQNMSKVSHIRQIYEWSKQGKLFTKIDFPGRVTVCEINNFLDVLIKLSFKENRKYQEYIIGDTTPLKFSDLFQIEEKNLKFKNLIKFIKYFSLFFPSKLRILLEDYLLCDLNRLHNEGLITDNDIIKTVEKFKKNNIW